MTQTSTGPMGLEETRKLINRHLNKLLNERIQTAETISVRYGRLWQSISRLANAGGKRIRPYLLNMICEAYGGRPKSKTVLQAAAAIELLHLSLLIHDDIIDNDLNRYGERNITGQYFDEYLANNIRRSEALSRATSSALLAGDLLLAEAHQQINNLPNIKPLAQKQISNIFSNAVFTTAGGELADSESNVIDTKLDQLEIDRQKTASYSFAAPLLIGASLANADSAQLKILSELANSLGIIYQLKDDLTDNDRKTSNDRNTIELKISELAERGLKQSDRLAIPPSFKQSIKALLG